ncbi:MAG: nickel-dependent lactate racemase [Desulfobacterales bacterium]|nr:nickel-dependent lactate racemase [Desulfobacterales bacterium]
MEIQLPWGKDILTASLPEAWRVHLPERADISRPVDKSGADIVQAALDAPIHAAPIPRRALAGRRILIVVDDNTRPTPAHQFFHLILDGLLASGAHPDRIHVMPAPGIHTAMTEDEMAEKIGAENLARVSWSNHDAFDAEAQHQFGTTSRGTPLVLNKRLAKSDLIIVVGMIEPHLWAGFGGGLKNIFPGMASAMAIGHHHGMIAEPPYLFNRVGLMPDENLFRKDLEEVRRFVAADIFCINVMLDEKREITAAFAGDPVAAHRQGVDYCMKTAGIRLDQPVDAVLVNSYPMEINFKQSMKCVGNALPALKPGGVVMAFLRAERGLDDIPLPDKPPPLSVLRTILRVIGKSNVMRFLNLVKKDLNVEERFLAYYSMRLIREYHLFCYVPSLSESEIRHLGFFHHCESPQSVIENGARKLKKNARVAVFPDGGATFPLI